MQQKRVNVILIKDVIQTVDGEEQTLKAGDKVMRVTESYAKELVSSGYWGYCSKSKLKSYMNKQRKLNNNERTISAMMAITGEDFKQRFMHLGRREKTVAIIPNFKYVANKGTKIVDSKLPKITKIQHANGDIQFVSHRINKKDGNHYDNLVKETIKVEYNPLFTKDQKMVGTGHKIMILAF